MLSNNDAIISIASPHTIKKFELIEAYVETWAHKLLEYGHNTGKCNGIVFIDCMCNSGVYIDETTGNHVEGTPIRVAKILSSIMHERNYQKQNAWLYFNDLSSNKIAELRKHLPDNTHNFHIETSIGDGNDLIKEIGNKLNSNTKVNYLLVYDPYQASIDWEALLPFIKNWGEIIVNHMVSDSIRAIPQAKRPQAVSKYEQTYLTSIEDLIQFGSDRNAFEQRIKNIISTMNEGSHKHYYMASYPFFNSKNAVVYNLIHCTSNINGFKLYKSTAWKTFNGRSSNKNSKVNQRQLLFSLDQTDETVEMTTETDDNCYCVQDIVKFIVGTFKGKIDVPLTKIWSVVDEHPVFPSDLYKNEIKDLIKSEGYKVHKSSIDFVR